MKVLSFEDETSQSSFLEVTFLRINFRILLIVGLCFSKIESCFDSVCDLDFFFRFCVVLLLAEGFY